MCTDICSQMKPCLESGKPLRHCIDPYLSETIQNFMQFFYQVFIIFTASDLQNIHNLGKLPDVQGKQICGTIYAHSDLKILMMLAWCWQTLKMSLQWTTTSVPIINNNSHNCLNLPFQNSLLF